MSMFHDAGPLLILATILLVGMSLGWLSQRIRLPSVTGQILGGIVLGASGLALFPEASVLQLQPLTHFALALIGITVGTHLNLRRLRNAGKRLAYLLIAEATIVPLCVWAILTVTTDAPAILIALLAPLAVSTAPATLVAIVRETRSRGVFVKTLIASVAINNIVCIFLFELTRYALLSGEAAKTGSVLTSVASIVMSTLPSFSISLGIGAIAGLITHFSTLRVVKPERLTTVSLISILATFGLSSYFNASPLLACMALGFVQTNLNPLRDRLADSVFSNFEGVIFCIFFTLAGMHLLFEHILVAGWVALSFFAARVVGKLLAATTAMRFAGATQRVRRSLGMALIPQAGVAIGLVVLIQDDPAFAEISSTFVAVVLTAVTLAEIIGPITARIALWRAGEIGRDHPRLVDFLQEENIITNLHAETMKEAIEKLTDLLISSHHLDNVDRELMLQSVLDREAQVSTCLGSGLAVPHGDLPEGFSMVGVMGISTEGLNISTPDGQPIHCIVLLATPLGERDRHLEVLAALARTIGADSTLQQALYQADSAAHAYEILHGEATEDFNYFLGDVDGTQPN